VGGIGLISSALQAPSLPRRGQHSPEEPSKRLSRSTLGCQSPPVMRLSPREKSQERSDTPSACGVKRQQPCWLLASL
jgi:hypothetical protein